MPEQEVTSLGQSHRSSKCQSKRLPPLGKATDRANARAKGYLPGAKPPIEQMPEQKVTSLGKATDRANARAKGYLPGPALRQRDQSHPQRAGRPGGRPQTGGPPHNFCGILRTGKTSGLKKALATRLTASLYRPLWFDAISVSRADVLSRGSTVSDSAMVAQLVPAAEIHWS